MENTDQTQMPNQPVGPGESAGQPQPELTVTDLNNLRSILDVAVKRGAFSAAEISTVGATFDKLNNFLNAVVPPKPDSGQA